MDDFYKKLNVSKMATQEEIKTSYKKLSKQYHPDKNPGDVMAEETFKGISEAYGTLSNVKKRKMYDNRMSSSFDFNRYADAFGRSDTTSFRKPAKKEPPKGNDLKVTVDLTLEEISTGCTKLIKLNKWNTCKICDGAGAKSYKTCSTCDGQGQVRKIRNISLMGREIFVTACDRCFGSGLAIDIPCTSCMGDGRLKEVSNIKINIPSLVHGSNFITITGEGDAGKNGGRYGNVHVYVTEIPHKIFKRSENNLVYTVNVSLTDLVLGTNVKIPTLNGKVEMKIPAGSQVGTVFKIPKKGLGDKGDLLVNTKLIIPEQLSDEQKKLFEDIRKLEKEFIF